MIERNEGQESFQTWSVQVESDFPFWRDLGYIARGLLWGMASIQASL